MANKVTPRVPRGMRDNLPEQMVRRLYVIDVIRGVFEEFGFEPLETPAIELAETLSGKYGSEVERLIYSASYANREENLMLRYDLSVPLCRVVAMYPQLPKPFKRYHIAPVWRADRPQKGRYREFYQCDADTVGSSSMLGDAETVAVIYTILHRLGFRKFTVHVNNRKILNGIGQFAGVPPSLLRGLYQSIDKLAKIGPAGVRQELLAVGLPEAIFEPIQRVARLYLQKKVELDQVGSRLREQAVHDPAQGKPVPIPEPIAAAVEPALREVLAGQTPGSVEPERLQEHARQLAYAVTPALRQVYGATTQLIPGEVVDRLLALLEIRGDPHTVLGSLRRTLQEYPEASQGIAELEQMVHFLALLGVPEQNYTIDVSMARGLEYYTGPIYETVVEEANIGSITGGGRYDNLIGMFVERSLPATGTTIGIERIVVVMEELNMFPVSIGKSTAQVLVTTFQAGLVDESIRLAVLLRQSALRTQIYFDADPLREQIGYAANKGIPILAILGPDEVARGQVTVRNLRAGEQQTVAREQAASLIRQWLA
jgi:histidyl-tRNA synthetase